MKILVNHSALIDYSYFVQVFQKISLLNKLRSSMYISKKCLDVMNVTDFSAPTMNPSIDLKDFLLYLSCPCFVDLRLG